MAYIPDDAGDTSGVADEERAMGSFAPIPEGWYRVVLFEDELVTKDWGVGLNMKFEILDGEHAGRKLFDFLCLQHGNAETVKLARIALRELAIAAGHETPDHVRETESIQMVPVMARVYRAIEQNEKYADDDGKKARIGEYKAVGGGSGAPVKSLPPKSRASDEPPPHSDDDIPF